jgi:hypothetical protein
MITSRGEVDIATRCDWTKGAALIADNLANEGRIRLDISLETFSAGRFRHS